MCGVRFEDSATVLRNHIEAIPYQKHIREPDALSPNMKTGLGSRSPSIEKKPIPKAYKDPNNRVIGPKV